MTRDIRLDILRVLSMLAVILIHVTAPFEATDTFDLYNPNSWVIEIINQSLFWCVPVFFMLSGALLLDKSDEEMPEFYKKRMMKILLPTLFWSSFFLVYLYLFKDFTLFNIAGSIFKGAPFYHLWFMFAIIGVYIFTPYLRVLLSHLSLAQTRQLIIIIFVFTIGHNYLSDYLNNQSTVFSSFISYLGYFVLGHYLYQTKHHFQIHTTKFGLFFLVSLIAVPVLDIYVKYILHISIPLVGYYPPLSALQAIALYLFVITADFKIKWPTLWIHLSALSFGVYLIHPLFILPIEPYMTANNLAFLPLFFICVLSLSYITVYGTRKLKYLKSLI